MRYAEALLQSSASTAPVQSNTEGLARMGQALVGGWLANRQNSQYQDDMAKVLAGAEAKPWVNPDTGNQTILDPTTGKMVPTAPAGGYAGMLAAGKDVKSPDVQDFLRQIAMAKVGLDQQSAESARQFERQKELRMLPQWQGDPASVLEYNAAVKGGYAGSLEDWKKTGAAQSKYGNTPIWGRDANGKPVLLQVSSAGGPAQQVDLPPGVTPERGQIKTIDIGPEIIMIDANGNYIGRAPKGLGPDRKITDERIVTAPAVPGAPPTLPGGLPQQPSAQPAMPPGVVPGGMQAPTAPVPPQSVTPPQATGAAGITDLPPTPDVVRKEAEKKAKTDKTFAAFEIGMKSLEDAFANLDTNPVTGRLPAVTAKAQMAEGAVSAMAPVLKSLFREAGEGTFTEKDQELLLNMAPKRTDHPEVVKYKTKMVRDLVAAKLGVTPAAAPQPNRRVTDTPAVGEVRDGYTYSGGNPADPKSWTKN